MVKLKDLLLIAIVSSLLALIPMEVLYLSQIKPKVETSHVSSKGTTRVMPKAKPLRWNCKKLKTYTEEQRQTGERYITSAQRQQIKDQCGI